MMTGKDRVPDVPPGGRPFVTRFAPSPSGYLHLGHAYAARFAWEAAHRSGGRFLLRIEDIDASRARPEFEQGICNDMVWLGLTWDGPLRRQSERLEAYAAALDYLDGQGVLYPCFCTRRQIRQEVAGAGQAPHGLDGEMVYPGICRHLSADERQHRIARGEAYAIRLDVEAALGRTGPLYWHDLKRGRTKAEPHLLGDVVLARKDTPTSYHLACTVDDAAMGVTLVTRGEDLFHSSHIHRLLQALLGLPVPLYYHHNLVADSRGQRMAKRNRAVSLKYLRDSRHTPDEIWRLLGLSEAGAATAICA
ncbi:tRNA glutamyl-Q(34) synthetase GluQRS [Marinivivus vitaminiproducens]|uniref:tRNA glutamyl-Q(34) synthetase GluQRS n=1 Tax=Marinivivus vitaminiproducens TaxID=3035935 RepID=UPI0027AB2B4C|nr:tRNA glutamyl-Q(34) synthetase GluQRS [Geminicoccaceae bacterium SCSIO 64248]